MLDITTTCFAMLHPTIDDDILFRYRETKNQMIFVYLFVVKYPLMKFFVVVLPRIVYKCLFELTCIWGRGSEIVPYFHFEESFS